MIFIFHYGGTFLSTVLQLHDTCNSNVYMDIHKVRKCDSFLLSTFLYSAVEFLSTAMCVSFLHCGGISFIVIAIHVHTTAMYMWTYTRYVIVTIFNFFTSCRILQVTFFRCHNSAISYTSAMYVLPSTSIVWDCHSDTATYNSNVYMDIHKVHNCVTFNFSYTMYFVGEFMIYILQLQLHGGM